MNLPLNNLPTPYIVENKRAEYVLFIIDFSMLCLAILNLMWMSFDEVFGVAYVQDFFYNSWNGFYNFYIEIHKNFLFYDGIFATIFISEFLGRWLYSMYTKRYSRWFMYPILHFYDLIGCLPTGPLRLFRLFRVLVLAYKLYKWRVLDFNQYPIVSFLMRYYNIIVEEIADRVAVRILTEVKMEFQRGDHLMDEVMRKVFIPRKEKVVKGTAKELQASIAIHYKENRREWQKYLNRVVLQATTSNREMENLEKIPVFGGYIRGALKAAISDIVFNVFDQIIRDFSTDEDNTIPTIMIQTIMDFALHRQDKDTDISVAAQVLNEILDIIIMRVSEKQWKLNA